MCLCVRETAFVFFFFSSLLFQKRCMQVVSCRVYISRVPDQNDVSLLYMMLEIHYSGREPSICLPYVTILVGNPQYVCHVTILVGNPRYVYHMLPFWLGTLDMFTIPSVLHECANTYVWMLHQ